MNFIKMNGIGNDYIYVDAFRETLPDNLSELAIALSNRNFGIGSDGLIAIIPSDVADFRMRMFNADGSEGKTCGNGFRCIAKYVYDNHLTNRTSISLDTLGGIVNCELHVGPDNTVHSVTVDIGIPRMAQKDVPVLYSQATEEPIIDKPLVLADGTTFHITCVSVGNPHCVIFVDDVDAIDIPTVGPIIENMDMFPEKVNVEFIQIISRNEIIFRVWERGSGITLACGSGACASVVAGVLNDILDRKVLVHLLGGDLEIEWNENHHIYMTGTAHENFKGTVNV